MACIDPRPSGKYDFFHREILFPCGVCPNCRADKISLIEQRAKYEWKSHEFCAFVRFSYDDLHLPYINYVVDSDNNMLPVGRPSIIPSDFKSIPRSIRDSFRYKIKKGLPLPKNCSSNFSWLGSAEYGDLRGRPHYHFIFFGLDFAYVKPFLQKLWPYGSIDVRPLKNGAIRYVLDYLSEEVNSEFADRDYFDKGLIQPFVSFSKSFGSDFYKANFADIRDKGSVRIGNRYVPVPSYYRNKYVYMSEEKIRELDYVRARRRLSQSANARWFGFKGTRPQVIRSYEERNSLYRARKSLIKMRDSMRPFNFDMLNFIDRRIFQSQFNSIPLSKELETIFRRI